MSMCSTTENCNRASSLPPECFDARECPNFNKFSPTTQDDLLSPQHETEIKPYNRWKLWPSINTDSIDTGEYGNKDGLATVRDVQSLQKLNNLESGTVAPAKILSPSQCSGFTDEDSGYWQSITHDKHGDSNNSLSNWGPYTLECNSGLSGIVRDELLNVMTEDLVDWFLQLYPYLTEDLDGDNFFDRISDGVILCVHVTEVHKNLSNAPTTSRGGKNYLTGLRVGGAPAVLPPSPPVYQTRGLNNFAASNIFVCRDNVSNFINWCRQLGLPDSVLFESEDLVCKKHPRNVAVCLLELARLGGRVGMIVPELVHLETEIDDEIAAQNLTISPDSSIGAYVEHPLNWSAFAPSRASSPKGKREVYPNTSPDSVLSEDSSESKSVNRDRTNRSVQIGASRRRQPTETVKPNRNEVRSTQKRKEVIRPIVDMRSLDEIVRDLLSQCTCKQMFPMIRVSEGRYLFGDKCTQIFVRILRNHVMVRVGGGWDTLNHFLTKYDECRKHKNPENRPLLGDTSNSIVAIESTEIETSDTGSCTVRSIPTSPLRSRVDTLTQNSMRKCTDQLNSEVDEEPDNSERLNNLHDEQKREHVYKNVLKSDLGSKSTESRAISSDARSPMGLKVDLVGTEVDTNCFVDGALAQSVPLNDTSDLNCKHSTATHGSNKNNERRNTGRKSLTTNENVTISSRTVLPKSTKVTKSVPSAKPKLSSPSKERSITDVSVKLSARNGLKVHSQRSKSTDLLNRVGKTGGNSVDVPIPKLHMQPNPNIPLSSSSGAKPSDVSHCTPCRQNRSNLPYHSNKTTNDKHSTVPPNGSGHRRSMIPEPIRSQSASRLLLKENIGLRDKHSNM